MLWQHRLPAVVRFGIRKAPEGLKAHAWVELNDLPLDEGDDLRMHYTPMIERARILHPEDPAVRVL
jgi:hypothetical protein